MAIPGFRIREWPCAFSNKFDDSMENNTEEELRMFQVSPRRVCLYGFCVCAMILLDLNSSVRAQLVQPMTTQDLADKADQIVVGACRERNVKMQGGVIVTEYKIKVSEFWKGQRPLDSNGEFAMTEVGGVLENSKVPVAQFVPGSSDILPGEDVLLFLNNRETPAQGGKRTAYATGKPKTAPIPADSPTLTGLWQGRFSVITNPKSGARMIAHTNISPVPGSPLNMEMREKLLKAQGVKTLTMPSGAKVAVTEKASELPEARVHALSTQLDNAAKHFREAHEELAKKSPKASDEIYQFEPVESVKSHILRLVKSKKQ